MVSSLLNVAANLNLTFPSSGLGVIIPAYKTFKAIKDDDIEKQKYLVKQWMIISLFFLCEQYVGFFISWLPFFYELKIALFAWLTLSQTKGAGVVYHNYVQPFLLQNEATIDSRIEEHKTLAKSRLQRVRGQVYQGLVSSVVTRFPQLQAIDTLLSSVNADLSPPSSVQVPRLALGDKKELEAPPCQDPEAPQQTPTPREGEETETSPRVTEAEPSRPRASSDSAKSDVKAAEPQELEERSKYRAKRALGQSYSLEIDSSKVSKRSKLTRTYAHSYK